MVSLVLAERSSADHYWLENCEGFRVDSPGGRIGIVEEALPSQGAIAVVAGLLGRRVLLVPMEEVEHVRPRERRIVLRASPELLGSAPARSWREVLLAPTERPRSGR